MKGAKKEPPAQNTGAACEHDWRVDFSIPVLDYGRYGIRSGACVRCGVEGQTDGHTGKWEELGR